MVELNGYDIVADFKQYAINVCKNDCLVFPCKYCKHYFDDGKCQWKIANPDNPDVCFGKYFEPRGTASVAHGRWEYVRTDADSFAIVRCSECGFEPYAIAIHVKEGKYCPMCGARMDGGAEEHS